ncbi:MAG: hypothetical protein OEY49_18585, partial [Candidatus Heimdallarchaeota archaeon]|nr:hypothetical protein [Candidatus Heimdallarchaeota archaeon]
MFDALDYWTNFKKTGKNNGENLLEKFTFSKKTRIITIVIDALYLILLFSTVYAVIFNNYRTLKANYDNAILVIFIIVPFIILIKKYEIKQKEAELKEILKEELSQSKKQKLSRSIQQNKEIIEEETEIIRLTNKYTKRITTLKSVIVLLVTTTIIITFYFLSFGSLNSSQGNISRYVTYGIEQNKYFLSFIFLCYLVIIYNSEYILFLNIFKGQYNPEKLKFKFHLQLFKNHKKGFKIGLALVLISSSSFAATGQIDGFGVQSLDVSNQVDYDSVLIYDLMEYNGVIYALGQYGIHNNKKVLVNNMAMFKIDGKTGELFEIQKLTHNNELNYQGWAVTKDDQGNFYYLVGYIQQSSYIHLYKYNVETEVNSILIPHIDRETAFAPAYFETFLVTFEGGIHIVSTPLTHMYDFSYPTIVYTYFEELDTVFYSFLNYTAWDLISIGNKTYTLRSSSNSQYFILTEYDALYYLHASSKVETELITTYVEAESTNNEDLLPNGATLFYLNNKLYYRSLNNLMDVSEGISSEFHPEFPSFWDIRVRILRGNLYHENMLITTSHSYINYFDINTLELKTQQQDFRSHYRTSIFSTLIISNDKLVS